MPPLVPPLVPSHLTHKRSAFGFCRAIDGIAPLCKRTLEQDEGGIGGEEWRGGRGGKSIWRRVARWVQRWRTRRQGVEGEKQEEQGMPREMQLRTYVRTGSFLHGTCA